MGTTVGRETDTVAFFTALAEEPFRHDFYQTLRRLECLHADRPRWGRAPRSVDEPVRLGQVADLSFAPAALATFDPGHEGRRPRLGVRFFGLLGPNGPLPLHLTEYAHERELVKDHTFVRFLDVFHHRLLALFYRAWAEAQPHVQHDRVDDDRFVTYVGSCFGLSRAPFLNRDTVPDVAKLFHVGLLARQVRNADGLESILKHFFGVPVDVQPFAGQYLLLGPRERTYLGRGGAALGTEAVLGARVWDRQHKFRIALGPLTFEQYESFLPSSAGCDAVERETDKRRVPRPLDQLVDWVRLYLSLELDWDVRLWLARSDVPSLVLGRNGRLGWTSWVGRRRADTDAGDLCLNAEALVRPIGGHAA